MPTQQLPLEALRKVRQFVKSGLVVPESENHPRLQSPGDDLPEPESLDALGDLFKFVGNPVESSVGPNLTGRWFISVVNPATVVAKLPGLELKTGWRLVSYLYRTSDLGVGATWAVPATHSSTAELEQALLTSGNHTQPPEPSGALADVMEAIDGDGSLRSYAIASIFSRELKEFGAMGSLQDWTHHRLMETVPTQVKWRWRSEMPKNLAPKVRTFPDGRAAVEFFTCRVVTPIAIFRHIDLYLPGNYRANGMGQAIAIV